MRIFSVVLALVLAGALMARAQDRFERLQYSNYDAALVSYYHGVTTSVKFDGRGSFWFHNNRTVVIKFNETSTGHESFWGIAVLDLREGHMELRELDFRGFQRTIVYVHPKNLRRHVGEHSLRLDAVGHGDQELRDFDFDYELLPNGTAKVSMSFDAAQEPYFQNHFKITTKMILPVKRN